MPDLKKNEIYTVTCDGYAANGDGVARIDGRVVFVKGLMEGETCRAHILKAGKNMAYAKIEELLERSPHRIEPDCPAFGRCGGCTLRHMDYDEELRFKKRKVNDCLRRIGGLDIEVEEIIGAGNIVGYRNKTIYTVGERGGEPVSGFYRPRSHDVVPVESCAVESDYSSRAAAAVREWMRRYKIPAFEQGTGMGVRRVFCRYGFKSKDGQMTLVTGSGDIPHKDGLIKTVLEYAPETVSIYRNINDVSGDTVLGRDFQLIWGRRYIEDELCGLKFRIAPSAFYQINRAQAEILYEKAIEYAGLDGSQTVLDLYCGAGTITLCLARKAREVIGIEVVEGAAESARENAVLNGMKNARFLCGDATELAGRLTREGCRPDVVVVDPPRKGLASGTPELIASMEPARVVYVSCDPATLARDLKVFEGLGYSATRATAVDMFPRTEHVECVVLMSRQNCCK